jgi:tRNA A37 threonylcarbamoyladenosine synthetase subunit TsaC/SUA5/YrdC
LRGIKPSSIIKFEKEELKILREGPIKKEEIERRIKK